MRALWSEAEDNIASIFEADHGLYCIRQSIKMIATQRRTPFLTIHVREDGKMEKITGCPKNWVIAR